MYTYMYTCMSLLISFLCFFLFIVPLASPINMDITCTCTCIHVHNTQKTHTCTALQQSHSPLCFLSLFLFGMSLPLTPLLAFLPVLPLTLPPPGLLLPSLLLPPSLLPLFFTATVCVCDETHKSAFKLETVMLQCTCTCYIYTRALCTMYMYIVCIHCTCTCIFQVTALGVLCCFALFVCLTLLASFFLPSHLSFKNMYMYMYMYIYMGRLLHLTFLFTFS